MYYACMPNVQVRDVSDEIHTELVRRAQRSGQSLQQYLTEQLELIATTPSLEDTLDQIENRKKGRLSGADAVAALDHARR